MDDTYASLVGRPHPESLFWYEKRSRAVGLGQRARPMIHKGAETPAAAQGYNPNYVAQIGV
ncbi:MAG: hypothetical protein OHK0022_05790 [Roseiflexaceae bacterium]